MYHMPCLVVSVQLAAAKIDFKEQALVADTKQSSQADKAGRLTWQAGRQCNGTARF
jgi:hypothetical protein